jgi:hypothetical protein
VPPASGTTNAPTCACQATLRAEAAQLLAAADKAKARGHRANADWCYRAAMGCGRAIGILKRTT